MSVRTENDSNFEKCIYDVKDVQTILGLGRSSTYDFIRNVYKKMMITIYNYVENHS